MNLHEYQGKEIFAKYDLPVSKGKVVTSLDEVEQACTDIGGSRWVAKAQVHAGGRGKSGGVALCDTIEEVADFTKKWLGKKEPKINDDLIGIATINETINEDKYQELNFIYYNPPYNHENQKCPWFRRPNHRHKL